MENKDFPEDLLSAILRKVSVKTLFQFRCVSKSSNALICDPDFINHHPCYLVCAQTLRKERPSVFLYEDDETSSSCLSKTAEFSFDDVLGRKELGFSSEILGCSGGLIFLSYKRSSKSSPQHVLWNPLVKKLKVVPPLESPYGINYYGRTADGFGFDHMTLDFKVVRFFYRFKDVGGFESKAFVYRHKIGTWKSIESQVPCLVPLHSSLSNCLFANGSMYWLARNLKRSDSIMAFDLAHEVFKWVDFPQNLEPGFNCYKLCTSPDKKSIVLLLNYRPNGGAAGRWDVWVMNIDDWKVECWTRKHVVMHPRYFVPLNILSDYQILAAVSSLPSRLILIDPKHGGYRRVGVHAFTLTYGANFTPSLALLDSGDEKIS